MTSTFITNNIDFTYLFLKTFLKKIKFIKEPTALKSLCEFMLYSVVKTTVNEDLDKKPNHNAKLLETGLKVLHKSWKLTLLHSWADHPKFRDELVNTINLVSEKYPLNDVFRGEIIKL